MGDRSASRLVAVAALGVALLGWPVLQVFDSPALVRGVPVLWLYLLVAWGAVIALVALASRER